MTDAGHSEIVRTTVEYAVTVIIELSESESAASSFVGTGTEVVAGASGRLTLPPQIVLLK